MNCAIVYLCLLNTGIYMYIYCSNEIISIYIFSVRPTNKNTDVRYTYLPGSSIRQEGETILI